MKKYLSIMFSMIVITVMTQHASAQFIKMPPPIEYDYVIDKNVGNGSTFTGTVVSQSGSILRYEGTQTLSNGDEYICYWFTPDFQVPYNKYYMYVNADHTIGRIFLTKPGGNQMTVEYDITGRAFIYYGGAYAEFPD